MIIIVVCNNHNHLLGEEKQTTSYHQKKLVREGRKYQTDGLIELSRSTLLHLTTADLNRVVLFVFFPCTSVSRCCQFVFGGPVSTTCPIALRGDGTNGIHSFQVDLKVLVAHSPAFSAPSISEIEPPSLG